MLPLAMTIVTVMRVKKKLEKAKKKEKYTAEKTKCYEEKLLNILHEKKKANTPTPSDKETYFALSLVPLLIAIPENSQLDVQIEIL